MIESLWFKEVDGYIHALIEVMLKHSEMAWDEYAERRQLNDLDVPIEDE